MKKKRYVLALLSAMTALTACGSSSKYMDNQSTYAAPSVAQEAGYAYDTAVAEAAEEEAFDGGVYEEMSAGAYDGAAEAVQASQRKLIKTVDLRAETEQFDDQLASLEKQVETLGGYIEAISVYDNDSYYDEGVWKTSHCASVTARIPSGQLDGFLSQLGEQTNVTSRSERVEDVTLQYVDLDSHKKVLLAEQDRLIELLSRAETIEDIIAIEGRLSEVRYQIESMESQLRTYDNKIDYSTVYLELYEVKKYTPPKDISVWEKIGNGFVDSLEDIGDGICSFFIEFVIHIPYLVIGAVLLVAAVWILRRLLKRFRKRGLWNIGKKGFFRRKRRQAETEAAAAGGAGAPEKISGKELADDAGTAAEQTAQEPQRK